MFVFAIVLMQLKSSSNREWLMVDSYVTYGRMRTMFKYIIATKYLNTQIQHRPTVFVKAHLWSAPQYYQLISIMVARCLCDCECMSERTTSISTTGIQLELNLSCGRLELFPACAVQDVRYTLDRSQSAKGLTHTDLHALLLTPGEKPQEYRDNIQHIL